MGKLFTEEAGKVLHGKKSGNSFKTGSISHRGGYRYDRFTYQTPATLGRASSIFQFPVRQWKFD